MSLNFRFSLPNICYHSLNASHKLHTQNLTIPLLYYATDFSHRVFSTALVHISKQL